MYMKDILKPCSCQYSFIIVQCRSFEEPQGQCDTHRHEILSTKKSKLSNVVFSSSSKSPSPSHHASQSSGDTSAPNPPPRYGYNPASAVPLTTSICDDSSKYDKHRQYAGSIQMGTNASLQATYPHQSPSSSQSASMEPHALALGYGVNSGNQRSRRRRPQQYHRESDIQPMQIQQRRQISRRYYKSCPKIHTTLI